MYKRQALDPESYRMESYTYRLHSDYGSPEFDKKRLSVERVELGAGGLSARLFVPGLRAGYVHEMHLPGVRSRRGEPLLHPEAYYTLIEVPPAEGGPPAASGR